MSDKIFLNKKQANIKSIANKLKKLGDDLETLKSFEPMSFFNTPLFRRELPKIGNAVYDINSRLIKLAKGKIRKEEVDRIKEIIPHIREALILIDNSIED